MKPSTPFDSEPDRELGRLLRGYWDTPEHAGFVARVVARAQSQPVDNSWDVLARWARPGLPAAAVVAVLLGIWLTQTFNRPAAAGDAGVAPVGFDETSAAAVPSRLLASVGPPTPDVVLAAVVEGR